MCLSIGLWNTSTTMRNILRRAESFGGFCRAPQEYANANISIGEQHLLDLDGMCAKGIRWGGEVGVKNANRLKHRMRLTKQLTIKFNSLTNKRQSPIEADRLGRRVCSIRSAHNQFIPRLASAALFVGDHKRLWSVNYATIQTDESDSRVEYIISM